MMARRAPSGRPGRARLRTDPARPSELPGFRPDRRRGSSSASVGRGDRSRAGQALGGPEMPRRRPAAGARPLQVILPAARRPRPVGAWLRPFRSSPDHRRDLIRDLGRSEKRRGGRGGGGAGAPPRGGLGRKNAGGGRGGGPRGAPPPPPPPPPPAAAVVPPP